MSGNRIAGLPVKAAGFEVFPEADGYVVYQAAREKVHLCDGRHSAIEITAILPVLRQVAGL